MKRHLTILLASILACISLTSYGQSCTGNLLTNPGFENNLNNWNPQGNVTAITSAHSGTKAARLGGTGYASIGQAFPTTAGTSYTASFWARNVGAVEMRFLNASWQQILGTGTSAGPTSATYQELTMTKIAPVGAVYVYLIAWKDGSQTMDVDDFCLMAGSTANYPDLVPSNLTVPATITHGTAFTYSFIAKNNGTAASAATSFSVEITGYEVARLPLQALQPGQQVTITKTMTLPQNFLYGSGSSMSVKLDLADDLVQELQENNNEVFAPLQVNQGTGGLNLSDLTPSNLVALPANGAPQNTSASVNFTISNLGTAPIFANPLNPATQNHVNSVYLSSNNLLDASDILLENSAVPMVTPIGSINNLSIVFTVPNGTPVGSYFLIVKLDGDQQVPEQNENNNTASIPFTVTAGTGPCTVVATLEAVECYDNQSPNDPTDDQYCVTLNVTYTGTGCSPYFTYNQENFTYGSSITVCGFPANGVSPVLLLHDSANPAAQTTVTATPPAGCLNTALPDLTLTDLQIPATVVAGSSFTANIIVRNIGTAASVPTGLLFYLGSQNPATITVPAIPAGGQLSYSPSISTSPNYTGPASLQAKIDQLGNVNIESNENNNEIGAAFNITSGGGGGTGQIDLSLALQQLTASPAQWSNYSVKLTISNAGPQTATGVKVKFAKPTGVVYVGGNQFTASQGTFNPNGDEVWTVGSIPANGSATLTVNYFLLNATAPVAYAQVTAANQTDSDSQPNNGTPPTPVQDDEASTAGGNTGGGNVCAGNLVANGGFENGTTGWVGGSAINDQAGAHGGSSYVKVCAQAPSSALNIMEQDFPLPGGNLYNLVLFAKKENATATGFFRVEYYNAANTLNGTSSDANITSTAWQQLNLALSPPATATHAILRFYAGPASSGLCISIDDICVTQSGPAPQPDLTIADLQIPTPSVAAGAILNYNFDASNAGTAAVPGNFTIKSYISTDQTLSSNDVQDGTIQTGNYAAGFSVQNVAGASTIPASLAAGQYYLIVKIDGDNAIAEGNENNNTVVKPFTVTAATSCQINPPVITTYCNDSSTPSNPADDQFYLYMNVTGTNTGSGWGVNGATGGFQYNTTSLIGSYQIASGPFTLTIADLNNQTCSRQVTITPPAPCSGGNTCAGNLLANPGFENGNTGWACTSGSPDPCVFAGGPGISGVYRGGTNSETNPVYQTVPASAGKTYTATVKVQTSIAATNCILGLKFLGSTGQVLLDKTETAAIASPAFVTKTFNAVAPAGTVQVRAYFIKASGGFGGVYTDDWCLTESGTGGGTPDCNAITITPGVGKITIAGFSAPHVLIKVFKPNWTVAYECLDGACANPTVITGLGTGSHFVEVKLMNATWGEICKKAQTVGVTNIAQQDDDRMRLSFDRIYPNPTAYQTTMELYSPVAQQATLDFYDRTGRLVHTQKVELEQGQNLIEHLVFDWKSGTYNVVARGEKTGLPAYGRFLKVWEE